MERREVFSVAAMAGLSALVPKSILPNNEDEDGRYIYLRKEGQWKLSDWDEQKKGNEVLMIDVVSGEVFMACSYVAGSEPDMSKKGYPIQTHRVVTYFKDGEWLPISEAIEKLTPMELMFG